MSYRSRRRSVGSAVTPTPESCARRASSTRPARAATTSNWPARSSAYFVDGDVDAIDAIDVDARGTSFQHKVWDALRRIPAGETASYVEIARAIGVPGASRAVGTANASNPIAVIVPCHRVVRADGSIGGYGGGVERKRWLLSHEQR